jgi:hypothetical protein
VLLRHIDHPTALLLNRHFTDNILTPFELGAACVIVGVGAALRGSVGFGFALVTAPTLVLISPRFVPSPVLVSVLVLSLLGPYASLN